MGNRNKTQDNIMFGRDSFLKFLEKYCMVSEMLTGQVWSLAENVFAAMVRPNNSEMEWRVNFYFDNREIKVFDDENRAQYMDEQIKRGILRGFTVAALTPDHDDYVLFAYFEKDLTGFNPENVLNCASNLFVKIDNSEVDWFESAEVLLFPFVLKKCFSKSV